MKKPARSAFSSLSLALALAHSPLLLAADGDLVLYMDSATKQIYAEPGPNRVKLGSFRPVDDAAPRAWFARLLWTAIQGTPAAP